MINFNLLCQNVLSLKSYFNLFSNNDAKNHALYVIFFKLKSRSASFLKHYFRKKRKREFNKKKRITPKISQFGEGKENVELK